MIRFESSNTEKDLLGIQELQTKNLRQNLSEAEISSQGFVTVIHSLEDLRKMNNYETHLVAKDSGRVVGYLLAMTKNSRDDIPVLIPMFDQFDNISYKQRSVSDYNYLVVGQVCIDKEYRGLGLLDKSYEAYRSNFQKKYDFAITEISTNNPRSLNAHKRIGFVEVNKFTDKNNLEWSVVLWDWNNPGD